MSATPATPKMETSESRYGFLGGKVTAVATHVAIQVSAVPFEFQSDLVIRSRDKTLLGYVASVLCLAGYPVGLFQGKIVVVRDALSGDPSNIPEMISILEQLTEPSNGL
jgi:hypothetical protein